MTEKAKTEKNEATTEITIAERIEAEYPILFSPIDIGKALKENLGDEKIAPRDLFFTVKIPSGGGTDFTTMDAAGNEVETKEITGIVLHVGSTRAYHIGEYGKADSDPIPACSSENGIIGEGTPGGDCSSCPLNEYKSASNGRAKACSEYKPVYMLVPGIARPITIRVSAASFKALTSYMINISMSGVQRHQVETKFSLKKVKGVSDFSQIVVVQGETINDAMVNDKVDGYRAGIIPFLDPEPEVKPTLPVATDEQQAA